MNPTVLKLFVDDEPVSQPEPEKSKAVVEQPAPPPVDGDPLANWKAEKLYYSVGEVASLFGVSTSTVRHWTKQFDLKVRTTAKGDRLFAEPQIRQLIDIHRQVKVKGLKIRAAKDVIRNRKLSALEQAELSRALMNLRALLVSIGNQIT